MYSQHSKLNNYGASSNWKEKKKKKKQPRMIYPELQIRQYIMQVQN